MCLEHALSVVGLLFGAATIQRWPLQRSIHTRTAPIISLLYARIMRVRIRINIVDPLPCGEISGAAFIGMSWQKHAATFSRVVGFRSAARFRGNTVYTCNLGSLKGGRQPWGEGGGGASPLGPMWKTPC